MPVPPAHAFRLSKEEYEVLAVVETKIDEYIHQNYYPGLTVSVTLPTKTVTDRLLFAVIERYKEVGWGVEQKSRNSEATVLAFNPHGGAGGGGMDVDIAFGMR
ncbi:MAG: hypothetical protein SF002_18385 [Alphaproteobacteria bacterium]|nr:hypothetical protein [Alphaproteobacteria bacterium]